MPVSEMIALFKKLDTIKRMLVAEVFKLVKLILILPLSNGVSERSFSFLKRTKTFFSLNNSKKFVKPSLSFAYP